MTEQELKAAFAAFLIDSPEQPLAAALRLFPAEKDRGEACRIAFSWPQDPEVIVEFQKLKANPKNVDIPTKEEFIAEIWKLAKDPLVSPKDRASHATLVANVLGFIAKPKEDDEIQKRMPSAPVYKVVSQ